MTHALATADESDVEVISAASVFGAIARDTTQKPEHERTVTELAAKLIVQFDNDVGEAAAELISRLKQDAPGIYKTKVSEAMLFWARTQVQRARNSVREQILVGAATRAKPDPGPIALRAFAMSWFDWPVSSGILLRHATRPQLIQAADEYQRDAETMLNRAGWLADIAESIPDDTTTVSQALSEQQVAEKALLFGLAPSRRAA